MKSIRRFKVKISPKLVSWTFIASLAFAVCLFWRPSQAHAYYFGMNSCDSSYQYVSAEYVTCGTGRTGPAKPPMGGWGVDISIDLPLNTTSVTLVGSSYDDFGFTVVNGAIVNSTMSAYYAGQECGGTNDGTYYNVPFTPGTRINLNIYSIDTCGTYQQGVSTFYITHDTSPPSGWISAPYYNPCAIPAGQSTCTSYLFWGTAHSTNTQLLLYDYTPGRTGYTWWNGRDPSGSWIPITVTASGQWVGLYGNGTYLGAVYVYGIPPPEPFTLSQPTSSCIPAIVQPTITVSWSPSQYASSYTVNGVPASSPYTYGSVANGSTTSFSVVAINSAGTRASSPATVTISPTSTPALMDCGHPQLHALVSPGSATVAPDVTQAYTAQISATSGDAYQVIPSGSSGLSTSWSASSALTGAGGSVTPTGTNALSATVRGGSLGDFVHGIQFGASFNWPGGFSATTTTTADFHVAAPSNITGDIHSGQDITDLVVDSNSVISATGNIADSVTGTNLKIPGYTPSNTLQWNSSADVTGAKESILREATQLYNEHIDAAYTLSPTDYTISSAQGYFFNLNPLSGPGGIRTDTHVNLANNEGVVWYVPGDLTINGPIQFYGRGTILVGGQVFITGTGCITAASDPMNSCITAPYDQTNVGSLGIILLGNGDVNIESTVTALTGAYFVPIGTINFKTSGADPALKATGLFVGNNIALSRKFATIQYDSRISKLPPPGFGVVSLPVVHTND